ncbi:MAG: efflux RND transporter periplasmic adaptor subunit [Pseudomonadota bacterium]
MTHRLHQTLVKRLMLTGFLALLLAGCGEPAQPQGFQQGPVPVPVAQPLYRDVTEWDEYTGRFEAVDSVDIQARVSGYLTDIHFEEGSVVEVGDLLFSIDKRPFVARVDAAQAELEGANAERTLADNELSRGQRLVRNNTISQDAFEQRRQTKLAADARVKAAEAALRSAELDLEFTEIRAPLAGRASSNFVSVGNLVSGGTSASTILTRIVSMDPIEFVFDVSEADYLKYARLSRSGERTSSRATPNPVQVRLFDEDDFRHTGNMNFVDNVLDEGTGTVRGRALFQNRDQLFIPGMFGRLRLLGRTTYKAILVPEEIILTNQTQRFVYVVGEDNIITPRTIELGGMEGELRVVESGLSRDDLVVIGGLMRLRPGIEIDPQQSSLSARAPLKPAPRS